MENNRNMKLLRSISTNKEFLLENYFFHSFPLDEKIFKDIILDGIKCKYLLGMKDTDYTYNGSYYVSIFKLTDKKIYPLYMLENNPLLILSDEIKTLKTNKKYGQMFSNTVIPLRMSPYENEYQTFLKIDSKKIIGIAYYLCESDSNLLEKLAILKLISKWLMELEKQILIVNSYNSKIINQDKLKELSLNVMCK